MLRDVLQIVIVTVLFVLANRFLLGVSWGRAVLHTLELAAIVAVTVLLADAIF